MKIDVQILKFHFADRRLKLLNNPCTHSPTKLESNVLNISKYGNHVFVVLATANNTQNIHVNENDLCIINYKCLLITEKRGCRE